MNIQQKINNLRFEPDIETRQAGGFIQICKTSYLNVLVFERTYFPHNFLKNITVFYYVDLVLPSDYLIKNGCVNTTNYYTEEGYGVPVFDELEDVIIFIDKFKKEN